MVLLRRYCDVTGRQFSNAWKSAIWTILFILSDLIWSDLILCINPEWYCDGNPVYAVVKYEQRTTHWAQLCEKSWTKRSECNNSPLIRRNQSLYEQFPSCSISFILSLKWLIHMMMTSICLLQKINGVTCLALMTGVSKCTGTGVRVDTVLTHPSVKTGVGGTVVSV